LSNRRYCLRLLRLSHHSHSLLHLHYRPYRPYLPLSYYCSASLILPRHIPRKTRHLHIRRSRLHPLYRLHRLHRLCLRFYFPGNRGLYNCNRCHILHHHHHRLDGLLLLLLQNMPEPEKSN
jgi:hypothetical protein